MLILFGLVIVFGSLLLGYTSHGGNVMVLLQVSEFIIICGAGAGALIIGNRASTIRAVVVDTWRLTKANPYDREAYAELLQMLYELFYAARRDGLLGIESHVEDPDSSSLFRRYPIFHKNGHAVALLTDTLKVLLTGTVEDHHLSEILEMDLEVHEKDAMESTHAMYKVADAMPAFGIVAAVLGVIITMGRIDGSIMEVGQSIAAALVGTFLGVFLGYGLFGPLAQAMEGRVRTEHDYLCCIRTAMLAFARGDPPVTCVEFARRNIAPEDRPSFSDLEEGTRRRGGRDDAAEAEAA